MTIVEKRDFKKDFFKNLCNGDIFFYESTGNHYIKVPEVESVNNPITYNAYDLNMNEFTYFNREVKIVPRNAELHLY